MSGVAVDVAAGTDAAELAALHAVCFSAAWSEREFASLLQSGGVAALVLRADGEARGFVMTRQALDEAEILTIGVVPHARVTGRGRQLLDAAEQQLAEAGAARVFLEVSVANTAARKLYDRAGYSEIGLRKAYYADGTDALVLEKWLREDGQTPA
jgi:ribosomal-protein-alanine N-acetyltransferase